MKNLLPLLLTFASVNVMASTKCQLALGNLKQEIQKNEIKKVKLNMELDFVGSNLYTTGQRIIAAQSGVTYGDALKVVTTGEKLKNLASESSAQDEMTSAVINAHIEELANCL